MTAHFTVLKRDSSSKARLGRLVTPHGAIATPCFMPVGTQGTVKAILPRDLHDLGCQILLCNTYHLYLRPGHELIRDFGGLHRFMGWDGPILTDSGGYQIFSLGAMRKISEEGARFQSHLDGSSHMLTPEKAVEIQEALGSDIAMVLDECIPPDATRDYVRDSTQRTIRWAERCLKAHCKADQLMFGIIQGGLFDDLRQSCIDAMSALPFEGFAVGGLGVGEGEDQLYRIGSLTVARLPAERPRYLMGVGRPQDILHAVRAGFDMFDCVIPTRNARNGTLFTWQGKINIKRAEFARDSRPLDENCGCYCCRNFSRAYLRHLYIAGEILSAQLNSLHNLYFYHRLMDKCREAIRVGQPELWPQLGEPDGDAQAQTILEDS
jgi:queuine tRNA-ribosyltransferase